MPTTKSQLKKAERRWNYHEWRWEIREKTKEERDLITAANEAAAKAHKEAKAEGDPVVLPGAIWDVDGDRMTAQSASRKEFAKTYNEAKSEADVAKDYYMTRKEVRAFRTRINSWLEKNGKKFTLEQLPEFSPSQLKTKSRQANTSGTVEEFNPEAWGF